MHSIAGMGVSMCVWNLDAVWVLFYCYVCSGYVYIDPWWMVHQWFMVHP